MISEMCSRKSWQKLYILHVLFGIRHTWYWLLIRTWKMTFLGKGPWLHFMALLIHFSEHAHLRILKKCKHERLVTRRNHISRGVTGGQGGRNSLGAESLWVAESLQGRRKVPKMSQVLSSIQWICFRKSSGSNMGASNLLLAPGAI